MNRVRVAAVVAAGFLAGAILLAGRGGTLAADAPEVIVKESLNHYFAAWNETDEAARRAHLEKGWAESATYTDPTADVHGREALVKHIGGLLSNPQFKGFSIVRSSGIDVHHRSFRFQWEMKDPSGNVVTPGIDYGEFDESGMITKIVGFFGPYPAKEE